MGTEHIEQPPAIDPERLAINQLQGLNCALCRARLRRARLLGSFPMGTGVHADHVELYACEPSCEASVVAEPHAWCHYCHDAILTPAAVPIGLRPGASGPGRLLYADGKCRVAYRVIPLDQHPDGTDGRPRYRDRQPFAPRSR
ncbi:hypothetical protein [Streptomyces sp. H39-S7]|uniref:hypothetical protein n=1 Tax=Streptomyces sp. H39-S7 TaxID=3004357 RepID=UPI0022AEDED8|nr:hypothetical protein [Streptomyces sp. H39-S7]MCZ4118185.1 hypothetical protein [Streptomyces sp. H39-S7]